MFNGEERHEEKGKGFSLQDLGIKIERAKIKLGPLLITIEDTESESGPGKKEKLESERDKLLERLEEINRRLYLE